MPHTRIKICGITRAEDAKVVADSGADALGLVFYPPSPRCVDLDSAQQIAAHAAPFLTLVGLFVDPEPEQVEAALQRLPLDMLQFHGDESADFCAGFGRPWMKALRVRPELDLAQAAAPYRDARAILLDAYQPGVPGGTGTTFDWELARRELPAPVVLAGGLQPANVGEAVAQLRPAAVDVSGGVESAPGIKDAAAVNAFVRAVREADAPPQLP